MRVRPRRLAGWLLGTGDELDGRVIAVSVHLDDAVFSLGAGLAHAARRGADVTILTVLANDPEREDSVGEWDARAGFASARDAAEGRRREDLTACARLGVRCSWLPYGDKTYGRGASAEAVLEAVIKASAGADIVLVPGFPLLHPDHVWLAELLDGRLEAQRVGRFVEQPYAALWTAGPPDDGSWQPLAASLRDRLAKVRAFRAYASQLPLLAEGQRPVWRTLRYEVARGGEWVQWQ